MSRTEPAAPAPTQPGPAAPAPAGRLRRWLRRPLLLLPVKLALVIAPMAGLTIVAAKLHPLPAVRIFVLDPVAVLCSTLLFALYTVAVEGRAVPELGPRGALSEGLLGFALGTIALAAVVGTLAAIGLYHVAGVADWTVLVVPLVGSLVTGVFEELLFRGVLFRIAEQSLGSYWALALSSLLFGAAHLLNPNATWLAAVAIMVEAGILLGAAYMLTRRLWMAIGIHAAWNFTQGGIFGVAVSGTPSQGLLHATLTGPSWLSGGAFGAEASVVALVLCGALGIALFLRARSLHHVVAPYWRRTYDAA